jgi:hypothetical protein
VCADQTPDGGKRPAARKWPGLWQAMVGWVDQEGALEEWGDL